MLPQMSPQELVRRSVERLKRIKAATDLVTLVSGQLLSKVFGFLAFAILARILTPSEYGAVETVVGMVAIGHMIIEFGSGILGIRKISTDKTAANVIASTVTSGRFFMTLLVAPTLVVGYYVIVGSQTPLSLISLFGISLFASALKLDWLFQAYDKMTTAAIGVSLKMIVFLVVIYFWPRSSFALTVVGGAEVLSMLAMALFYFFAQRRELGLSIKFKSWRSSLSFLKESAPLGLSSFANTLSQAVPVLMIQAMSSASEAGEFGAAQRVITSLITFSWLYYQNFFGLLTRQIAQAPAQAQKLVMSSDRFVAWGGIACGVFLTVAAQPLMQIAFGEALSQSFLEFSVLAWCLPVTLASGSARWLLIAQDKHKSQMFVQFAGAFVSIAVTFLFTRQLGGLAAAIGMLCGAILIFILANFAVRSCAIKPHNQALLLPGAVGIAAVIAGPLIPLPRVAAAGLLAILIVGLALLIPKVRASVFHLIESKHQKSPPP